METVKKLNEVNLEFEYEETWADGIEREEAEEMQSIDKYLSKIVIKRDGKLIATVEAKLYNTEFTGVRDAQEEDDFAMLDFQKQLFEKVKQK